jgi:hypothetical protein
MNANPELVKAHKAALAASRKAINAQGLAAQLVEQGLAGSMDDALVMAKNVDFSKATKVGRNMYQQVINGKTLTFQTNPLTTAALRVYDAVWKENLWRTDICRRMPRFCAGNMGTPRWAMPQLPGDKAGLAQFYDDLVKGNKGVKVEIKMMKVRDLIMSQSDLYNPKVDGMVKAIKSGAFKNPAATYHPPVINRGVLDGQHRLAALMRTDPDALIEVYNIKGMTRSKFVTWANKHKLVTQAGLAALRGIQTNLVNGAKGQSAAKNIAAAARKGASAAGAALRTAVKNPAAVARSALNGVRLGARVGASKFIPIAGAAIWAAGSTHALHHHKDAFAAQKQSRQAGVYDRATEKKQNSERWKARVDVALGGVGTADLALDIGRGVKRGAKACVGDLRKCGATVGNAIASGSKAVVNAAGRAATAVGDCRRKHGARECTRRAVAATGRGLVAAKEGAKKIASSVATAMTDAGKGIYNTQKQKIADFRKCSRLFERSKNEAHCKALEARQRRYDAEKAKYEADVKRISKKHSVAYKALDQWCIANKAKCKSVRRGESTHLHHVKKLESCSRWNPLC